ncbi:hypothetical protein D3C75_1227250 [compost metagenome]
MEVKWLDREAGVGQMVRAAVRASAESKDCSWPGIAALGVKGVTVWVESELPPRLKLANSLKRHRERLGLARACSGRAIRMIIILTSLRARRRP